MNQRIVFLGIAILSQAALFQACSEDKGDPGAGGTGTAGTTGGSGTGGTTGTGGAAGAGTTGTGGTTGSGGSSGGSGGAGGSAATGGSGGATTGGAGTSGSGGASGSGASGGSAGKSGSGGAPDGGNAGAGTGGNSGVGGTAGAAGMAGRSGSAGSDAGSGTDGGNPDPNCTTANARTGATCTQNCLIGCGFNGIGTKTCTCVGGVYSECPCPRPAGYMGAATAPYCATSDGTTTALKNMPCATEWDQCIGKDVVTGTTPQGCACLRDPASTMLLWACGSTNKWFALSDGGM